MAIGPYITLADVRSALQIPALITDNDDEITRAIDAASRAIDRVTGRFFYQVAESARTYKAEETDVLDVHDVYTNTGLVVKLDDDDDGTYETTVPTADILLEPVWRDEGHPWTRLAIVDDTFPTEGRRPRVQVTASWGWQNVPDEIEQACQILATRLFKRKDDAGSGVIGANEFGAVRLARTDPDVMGLIGPFCRYGLGAV